MRQCVVVNRALRTALAPGALMLLAACAHGGTAKHYAPGPEDDGFSTTEAFDVAGSTVPEDVMSFYFLLIDDSLKRGEDVDELLTLMTRAHGEKDYLGVAGPVAARNLDVVAAALDRTEPGSLRGLPLIYLGPPQHIEALVKMARRAGLRLHFLVYPADAAPLPRPHRRGPGDAAPL